MSSDFVTVTTSGSGDPDDNHVVVKAFGREHQWTTPTTSITGKTRPQSIKSFIKGLAFIVNGCGSYILDWAVRILYGKDSQREDIATKELKIWIADFIIKTNFMSANISYRDLPENIWDEQI